jgi:predicted RNA methylase
MLGWVYICRRCCFCFTLLLLFHSVAFVSLCCFCFTLSHRVVRSQANLAYAMLRCANVQKGDFIVDPFCGGGTILFEALAMYQQQLRCFGSDVSKRCVAGAITNAAAMAYPSGACTFECCDARNIRRCLADDSVDAIVTNLPWGVVTGQKMTGTELQTMYEIFLRTVWYTLKDRARVVVLVLRGLQFTRILRKLSGRYRILSANIVRTTNNLPCIIVAEKLAIDDLNGSLKGQLASLSRFVNFSPEIYQAIHEERLD